VAKVAAEVGSTANRYQILGKLAVGGMAEIFLARGANATGLERYCVLKRVLRERASDAQFVQMFLDEARLAAQLQHPNIASVYDIGMLGDSYFFTMEYVHGETVRALLHRAQTRRRTLPLACVLTIAAGAAAGLHHAHDRVAGDGRPLGIVHRDVSPSNLMVSYEGNVKLVDFGVAKADDRVVETKSGTVKGKISYLSPEQCRGARVDRRSDLFSLGIVMWEMLTGGRLYRRNSDFENMTAIVHEPPPPPPSARRAEVPRAVDDIVMRLLAKSAGDRFQTAGELVEAIENASLRAGTMLSSSALARLIRDLFGTRAEPWLDLGDTAPHRVLVASPLSGEIVPTPLDPVEAELAAVPDLSISALIDDDVSAPVPAPAAPQPPSPRAVAAAGSIAPPLARGAVPVAFAPSQPPGAISSRALLDAIAAAIPASPAPVTTLLGHSAPGNAAAMAAIRQAAAGLVVPSTTVRDLSPPDGVVEALASPTRDLPSAPHVSSIRPSQPQRMQSGAAPVQYGAAPRAPAANPASSVAITQYRGRAAGSRFMPTLIAIMVIAAIIGAAAVWYAMQ
jgi:serine/threonine protein kinase